MYKSTIAALTLVGMVSAQSSVVDLYLGWDDTNNLIGSVIASDKTATTYSITCRSTPAPTSTAFYDDSDNDCGIPPSFTFTQGPSTLQYSYVYSDFESDSAYGTHSASSYSVQESMVLGCVISGSSSGICSVTQVGNDGVSSFSYATTTAFDDIATLLSPIPVTITAGAIASTPNTASATATATAKSSGSKSTGTASSSSNASGSSDASGASASKASATGSSTNSVSTGGMPMVTAKAQWVIGAAAAIAYAAM
jgi:hypothetical protein